MSVICKSFPYWSFIASKVFSSISVNTNLPGSGLIYKFFKISAGRGSPFYPFLPRASSSKYLAITAAFYVSERRGASSSNYLGIAALDAAASASFLAFSSSAFNLATSLRAASSASFLAFSSSASFYLATSLRAASSASFLAFSCSASFYLAGYLLSAHYLDALTLLSLVLRSLS